MTKTQQIVATLAGLAALVLMSNPTTAADTGHGERLSLDPETGQWTQLAAPVPGTEDGDLELARAMLARGKVRKARAKLKKWLKTYPDSLRILEAQFHLADAKLQLGDTFKAYELFEQVLDGIPPDDLADKAMRRELTVAKRFLEGKRRRILGVPMLKATEEGLDILDNLAIFRAPGSDIAEQALRMRADFFFDRKNYDDAEQEYARLIREFPNGAYTQTAALRSAESALKLFKGTSFDDTPLLEAATRYRLLQQRYPELAAQHGVADILDRIRNLRAQKAYEVAQWYSRTKRYTAAQHTYEVVMQDWADTPWADRAAEAVATLPQQTDMPAEGSGQIQTAPTLNIGLPVGGN